jgi:hypothetical protein
MNKSYEAIQPYDYLIMRAQASLADAGGPQGARQ